MKRGRTQRAKPIRGMGNDAAALGITRQHLHAVLSGRRISRRTLRRYRELQASKNGQQEN